MKLKNSIKYLACFIGLSFGHAQEYNHVYEFDNHSLLYKNSTHLAGFQISQGEIIEGGTVIDDVGVKQAEITRIDHLTGIPAGLTRLLSIESADIEMVDLVESSTTPNSLIVLANIFDSQLNRREMVVFKIDVNTGVIAWTRAFGSANTNISGAALTRDGMGNYFILGDIPRTGTSGVNAIYVLKLTELGAVLWEKKYHTNVFGDNFEAVDIIFEPNNSFATCIANYGVPLQPAGFVILELFSNTGNINADRHVLNLIGTQDIEPTAIDTVNGVYSIVGHINGGTDKGFLTQYMPGLFPVGAFGHFYSAGQDTSLHFTGIIGDPISDDMLLSYDYILNGVLNPGLLRVNRFGLPQNSVGYDVGNYVGSKGLFSFMHGLDHGYIVKGATDPSPASGLHHASLISMKQSFSMSSTHCPDTIPINHITGGNEQEIMLFDTDQDHSKIRTILTDEKSNEAFDCSGASVGLSPENTVAAINDIVNNEISIYPMPATDYITISLGEETKFKSFRLVDISGKIVLTGVIGASKVEIDLRNIESGQYICLFESDETVLARRVVISE